MHVVVTPTGVSRVAFTSLSIHNNAINARKMLCDLRRTEAVVWRGDYHVGRELLSSVRRLMAPRAEPRTYAELRALRAVEASVLARFMVPLAPGTWSIPLRRGPPVVQALTQVHGAPTHAVEALVPVRFVLACVAAHEWRKRGVLLPDEGLSIHPHFGVFSPTRSDYVALVRQAVRERASRGPPPHVVWEVGVGCGVLSAVMAHHWNQCHVFATDSSHRAVACAVDNMERLQLTSRVQVAHIAGFPADAPQPAVIVCNPPWLPAIDEAPEGSVYDHSNLADHFVSTVASHLATDAEAWFVMSDLAELFGARSFTHWSEMFAAHGLRVIKALRSRPPLPPTEHLPAALNQRRAFETVTLWRLARV